MYEEHFGLREKPFSILPDPSFLYWAQGHSMAFAMLEYGILNQAGFTVITGEIGCGKTTLVRQLLDNLDDDIKVGLITNTLPDSGRLLEWVLMALEQPFESTSYVELYKRFQEYLIEQYAKGSHTVLIIDEAQNFGVDALEELRMLSNINSDKAQLLQLVLVGQPQLRDLLQHPSLTQFAQRVSSDYHLCPLSPDEVHEYIQHRVAVAGAEEPLFTRRACDAIASASNGVPRSINVICDTALVYAYSLGAPAVTSRIVGQVLADKSEFGVFSGKRGPMEALPTPMGKQV